MIKIKCIASAMILALIIALSPVQAQERRNRQERRAEHRQGEKMRQRATQRQQTPLLYTRERPQYQRDRNRDYDQRSRRRSGSGFRLIIIPRVTFTYPYRYRGFYIYNDYGRGYRDGFYRGRQDFRRFLPCDPNFQFDYRHSRNEDYRLGFLKGYSDGCRY